MYNLNCFILYFLIKKLLNFNFKYQNLKWYNFSKVYLKNFNILVIKNTTKEKSSVDKAENLVQKLG